MVKNLRSFIHEKFPIELQVELDLISRRRDIRGDEKPGEILNLLRQYEVGDVVKLSPGTNRYGIKLDGFVVKIATDNDGKVDNKKEFKMAKRLYPDVPMTHEVSNNGSILIAEYVQPFVSFTEMLQYADRIREILTKWSSTYLIGDVGITSKNYVNWGLRVGTDDPVCLDFAYIFDASSDIFICRHCRTRSMLIPNKDFTKLICPNKACGKETSFEDIRAMIPNDYHNTQIGDLSKEGYLMTSPNAITELTEERSNYLVKKRKPNKEAETVEAVEAIEEDVEKEEVEMAEKVIRVSAESFAPGAIQSSSNNPFAGIVLNRVNGTATVRGTVVQMNGSCPATDQSPVKPDTSDSVVFSGAVTDIPEDPDDLDEEVFDKSDSIESADTEEQKDEQLTDTNIYRDWGFRRITNDPVILDADPIDTIGVGDVDTDESIVNQNTEPDEEDEEFDEPDQANQSSCIQETEETHRPKFQETFIKGSSHKALSIVSNKLGMYLREKDMFALVKPYLNNRKMWPDEFYQIVQNALFKSLSDFLGFISVTMKKDDGSEYNVMQANPTIVNNDDYFAGPTLKFIERVYQTKKINQAETGDEMFIAYLETYKYMAGIQVEWIEMFLNRLGDKLDIRNAKQTIRDILLKTICSPVVAQEWDSTVADADEDLDDDPLVGSHPVEETEEADQDVDDASDEDEYTDYLSELESEDSHLSVLIFPEDEYDILRIEGGDAFGSISVPIYTNLDKLGQAPGVVVYDRNGSWDWLTHMAPDMLFKTTDPEKWLDMNDDDPDENQCHIVIMDQDADTNEYIMGVFMVNGIYIVDENMEYISVFDSDDPKEMLRSLNIAISDSIGNTGISHRERSLSMKELIHDESYIIENCVMTQEDDDDEGDEDETDSTAEVNEDSELTSAEKAAMAAITECEEEQKKASPKATTRQRNARGQFVKQTTDVKESESDTKEQVNSDEIKVVRRGRKNQ